MNTQLDGAVLFGTGNVLLHGLLAFLLCSSFYLEVAMGMTLSLDFNSVSILT